MAAGMEEAARCRGGPGSSAVLLGPATQVKECFVIDFDVDAYMAAARGPAAAHDFFLSRMVLSEGARVRCTDPTLGQQASGGSLRQVHGAVLPGMG